MPSCHHCNAFIPVGKDRCPNCAAQVPEASAAGSSSSPGPGKNIISAGGNVDVHHDASTQTIYQTTHSVLNQQEDRSIKYDQRVTQTHGMHPLLVVSLICVVVIGFATMALILKQPSEPSPVVHSANLVTSQSSTPTAKDELPTAAPVTNIPPNTAPKLPVNPTTEKPEPGVMDVSPEQPGIVSAEVGIWRNGHFEPRSSFKSGELLTLRMRVSSACQVRVLYQPTQGDPMLMFPEKGAGSSLVQAGEDVFIPDPLKLAAKSPDATAFELFHDRGSGPALVEKMLIQVSADGFTTDEAVEVKDAPYRMYAGLNLEQAKTRGIIKRLGAEAVKAHSKMEADLSQKIISFSINP